MIDNKGKVQKFSQKFNIFLFSSQSSVATRVEVSEIISSQKHWLRHLVFVRIVSALHRTRNLTAWKTLASELITADWNWIFMFHQFLIVFFRRKPLIFVALTSRFFRGKHLHWSFHFGCNELKHTTSSKKQTTNGIKMALSADCAFWQSNPIFVSIRCNTSVWTNLYEQCHTF